MLSLIGASPDTASQIPFWLQILSIAVSPIIGFIGVAIGASLTERNRRTAYLFDEKKKLYLEFIDMLASMSSFWSNRFPMVMRSQNGATEVLGFSQPMIESLQRAYVQTRVLGSQAVVDAAGEGFQYILMASLTGITMLKAGYDLKEWSEVVDTGIKVMAKFSDAARRDLGLPNLESAGRSAPRLRRNELLTFLEEALHIGKGKTNARQQSGGGE